MNEPLHPVIAEVTERIVKRSAQSRAAYLRRIILMHEDPDTNRQVLSCSNLAHAAAGAGESQADMLSLRKPHVGIITAYNDMLSAHQPFSEYPAQLKRGIIDAGGTAQVAGATPAMCDGVTQGRPGMELSLMSRDVIAQSCAVGLSHNVYDAALCLGVCDKIVPGLVMGALAFGHLPVIFVPAGPMSSGLSNEEKARTRNAFARGEATRAELLASEAAAYHGPGTCTFYGTANSNQMLMEIMGLHLPGATFVHPHSELRAHINQVIAQQIVAINRRGDDYRPLGKLLDEKSFVNAIVGLHATGGSTNHTLHLPAMAAMAGIVLTWQDFADLSAIVPLLSKVYPNGSADVNHFHAAGGMGFLIAELLQHGLLHPDARTVWGDDLRAYTQEPSIDADNSITWRAAVAQSLDTDILRPMSDPHQVTGGLRVLEGNLGRAVVKVSAVAPEHHIITAPAAVFADEAAVKRAFDHGALNRDVVVVVRYQGPRANGMPELHSLIPALSVLQAKGYRVALVTDGRMSGASGKVPAAIHVCPEASQGGAIGRVQDGDMITLDCQQGTLHVKADLSARLASPDYDWPQAGFARELFNNMRHSAASAEAGGGINPLLNPPLSVGEHA